MIAYKDVLSHETAIRFQEASNEYGIYCRGGSSPPGHICVKFKAALQEYRDYLDSVGIHMKQAGKRIIYRDSK